MLIILEGVDGAGKTTLAKAIEQNLLKTSAMETTVEVLHKSAPKADAVTEYEYPLSAYRPGDRRHVICDRWHLGEEVYGPHLRGSSLLDDPAAQLHVDMFLQARGAILVYVHETANTLRRRLRKRGDEDVIDLADIEDLQDAYGRAIARSELVQTAIGYVDMRDSDTAVNVVTVARAVEQSTIALAGFRSYVGPPQPSILLVGEKHNTRYPEAADGAFTPINDASSAYLLRNLPPEFKGSIGMVNAVGTNLGALYSILGRPLTVALGRVAHTHLQEEAIRHGAVPHPAFVRRFHAGSDDKYRRLIRDAALTQKDLA